MTTFVTKLERLIHSLELANHVRHTIAFRSMAFDQQKAQVKHIEMLRREVALKIVRCMSQADKQYIATQLELFIQRGVQ